MSIDDMDTVDELVVDLSLEELAAKFFGPPPVQVQVTFGAKSHRGHVRSNNEDHFMVVRRRRTRDLLLSNLPDGFLPASEDAGYAMVVADGIGGAAFGELASMLALRAAWDLTTQAFKWPFSVTDREAEELTQMLRVYGQLMQRRLMEHGEAEPRFAGMGTTVTAAITVGREAFIGHVGDSRAYLFREARLARLTRDHTLAQHLVDAGAVQSLAEAPRRMRNMLVNFLGGKDREHVDVDVHRIELANRDRLLLCTDGLSDMVSDEEIAATLKAPGDAQAACDALTQLALDHGGRDNVTVTLADFEL